MKRVLVLLAAIVVALGIGAVVPSGAAAPSGAAGASVAAPTPDPAHDYPCGKRKAGATRIEVCERTTGYQGMSPMVQVNSRGTLFMSVATENAVLADPTILNGTQQNHFLRSRDDGRTWERLPLPLGVIASEAIIYLDPPTDRLFATSMSYDLTDCGYPVAWSDDEGATWTMADKRPGCTPLTIGDWPKIFTGPFPAGIEPQSDYPRAIYSCNFTPNILVALSLRCWSSFDGGKTFAKSSKLPVTNFTCRASDGNTTVQGTGLSTIVHGTGQVLADGTVVIPVMLCGRIIVVRSTDGAQTWSVHDTGSVSVGWFNWLSNLTTQTGADNIYNMMAWDQGLAQDAKGNLFLGYPTNGGVKLAVSRDGGRTWRQRGMISTKGVNTAWLVSLTARGKGEVGIAYIGTTDVGEPILSGGERFRNWMGYSPNAFKKPFAMAPTSPLSDPTMVAGGILGGSISCCADLHQFNEYVGIRFTGPDQLRAAFFRDGGKPNTILTLGKATIR